MSSGPTCDAQIVQTTRNGDHGIGEAIGGVAELILGDATDFYARDGVLDAHARSRQMAIVPFLGRRQRVLLGLFFGCKCWRTPGA